MDVSTLCDDPVSEYVNGLCDLRQSNVSHKQLTCSNSCIIEGNVFEELGNAFSEILHVQDVQDLVSVPVPTSDEDEIIINKGKLCEELKIHQANSSTVTTQKSFSRCATFPISKQTTSHIMSAVGIPDIASEEQSSMNSENPTCARTISLPIPLKLVSAMKGGREKQGTPHLKKLTVTWAPDVYDPPTMSLSHTVKSHSLQRSRTSKKSSKHKHKGKSSRGSNSNKKQYQKYIGNHELRSKRPAASDKLLLRECSQSTVELVDFAVIGQESKCGSSFLRTSLGKVHTPVTEAT